MPACASIISTRRRFVLPRARNSTAGTIDSVATGVIMEAGVEDSGYNTLVPQSKRGLGDILKLNGYNTAWFGKNQNVPDWQTSQAGPFNLWPVGLWVSNISMASSVATPISGRR